MIFDVSSFPEARAHLRTLTFLSLFSRVLVAVLIVSSAYLLTPFDTSAQLLLSDTTSTWISSLLRWDTFHFALVVQKGYVYEHSWAFFPALPFIMRLFGRVLSRVGLPLGFIDADADVAGPLLGGAVLAALCDSTRVLYRLSLYHLRSPSAAFLAVALSLLSSSPATLRFAAYTEPFFTYCSYRGMWACARARWTSAAVWFALASAFRSNGIFLAGFIVWGMLVEPYIYGQRELFTPSRMFYCALLSAFSFVPFLHHNYSGYLRFCLSSHPNRPAWCDRKGLGPFPSIYAHVQARYWQVGFMRYWTVSNLPNFVLAMPILACVYAFGAFYLSRVVIPGAWHSYLSLMCRPHHSSIVRPGLGHKYGDTHEQARGPRHGSLFLAPSLLPHVLHALVLTLLLTFNAHVQIALRVLPSLPMVYWAAAWLLIERRWWGKAWVVWSVMWGATSSVLWAVFLPPA